MHNFSPISAFLYTLGGLASLAICTALIVNLDWPLLAELPIALVLFVHLLAATRWVLVTWAWVEKEEVSFGSFYLKAKRNIQNWLGLEDEMQYSDQNNIE